MLNILLVDDHDIIRAGLKYLIKNVYSEVETDEANNATAALRKIFKTRYDLMILDINLPDTDTFTLINKILLKFPGCKILLFSLVSDYSSLKRYIKSGVMGYVNKNGDSEEILQAIKTTITGNKYIGKEVMDAILDDKFPHKSNNPFDLLSEREYEITKHLLTGDNLTRIAQRLNIHTSTAGTHKSRVFTKLKVSNLVELMTLARNYQLN